MMGRRMSLMHVVGLLIAVLIFAASTAATPTSTQLDPPSITWTPRAVSLVMPPGASHTMDVSFTSAATLKNAAVGVVPEIVHFLSLQPGTLAAVPAGTTQHIQISFSVPSGTAPGTYEGTIHIREGAATLPQTLKVSLSVTTAGVVLSVPEGFQVDSTLLARGGPISLDNFGHQYLHGGITPPGGAEIVITSVRLPPPPLMNLITHENQGQGISITSTSRITVSGSAATEVFSTDTFTFTLPFKRIAVYAPHNDLLFKLYLTYRAGDPFESQFLASFQQVLSSVQFTS